MEKLFFILCATNMFKNDSLSVFVLYDLYCSRFRFCFSKTNMKHIHILSLVRQNPILGIFYVVISMFLFFKTTPFYLLSNSGDKHFKVVVLPAPFGPTKPTISPSL